MFLMHRVELKVPENFLFYKLGLWFLMHRVELKVVLIILASSSEEVPNAPCGVERKKNLHYPTLYSKVPNAPCGVESLTFQGI